MALLTRPVAEMAETPEVRACVDWFRRERAWINEQHLKLCRVPAPTFFEQKRAEWMAEKFKSLGWDAKIDRAGNVIATRSRDACARRRDGASGYGAGAAVAGRDQGCGRRADAGSRSFR